MTTQNNTTLVTLDTAKQAGQAIYNAVRDDIKSSNTLASLFRDIDAFIQVNEGVDNLQALITPILEAILDGASRHNSAGKLILECPVSKLARKKVWANIAQATSKQGLLFVGDERPQAKQGSNHLVVWSTPQTKTATTEEKITEEKITEEKTTEEKIMVLAGLALALASIENLTNEELMTLQQTITAKLAATKPLTRKEKATLKKELQAA
jgi:hypothetical protein